MIAQGARARRSSTTCAPAARSPTPPSATGGTALMNRVGHAFFKTRMREENAVFGGEVSGHYYFRDFYCADSGTIPALLILELLSERGAEMSELLEPLPLAVLHLRRDQHRGRRPGGEDRGARASATPTREQYRAGRRLGRLRRLALQRAPVEHRAAAAAVPRVAALREDMERRRDEVLAMIRS